MENRWIVDDSNMESACRLCLESSKSSVDIFNHTVERKVSEIIEIICGIRIEENDFYSKQVCGDCLETVNRAYALRILSKKNEEYWKLRDTKNNIKDEEILEETVEEFVKFESSPSSVARSVDSEGESLRDCGEDYEIVEVSMQPDYYSEDDNEVFRCDQCSQVKPTKEAIERHILNEHLTSTCSTCRKVFNSCNDLRQHVRKSHAEYTFSCGHCSVFFKTRKKLEKHQQLHSFFTEEVDRKRRKSFRCKSCARTFEKLTDKLHEHINHHSRLTSPEKRQSSKDDDPLVCPHCGQIYRTKQILQQHIKRHFDTGDKYACPKCPQRFKSWGELYYHNAVHTTDRNFVCEICSKAFKAKRDLRNHRIRHENKDVKKFQCTYCQLMLKSKYTLNRHILIHTGEKKFQCSYCQKAFTQKNELNKHLRVHIGENTYRCEEAGCTEAFRLLAEFRIHQQIHYERTNNDEFEN